MDYEEIPELLDAIHTLQFKYNIDAKDLIDTYKIITKHIRKLMEYTHKE